MNNNNNNKKIQQTLHLMDRNLNLPAKINQCKDVHSYHYLQHHEVRKDKTQVQDWEKIFTKDTSNKGSLPKVS